jgi:cell division inhibitor SepF
MGFFRKSLVYLGLVEDEDFEEYEDSAVEDIGQSSPPYKAEPNVRKLNPHERKQGPAPANMAAAAIRPMPAAGLKNAMHIIEPKGFGDAEQIGERFRQNMPVLMNLQYVDTDLAKRLIDFASGLTFGLGGNIQRAADKVFLLVPANMEVSAEEKMRLQEQGLFNQF